MESHTKEIYTSIIAGKTDEIKTEVQALLNTGPAFSIIVDEGMIATISEMGRLFEIGENYVPELI